VWFTLAEQSHIQLQFLKAPFWCSEYATNFGMMNIDFLLFSFTMMTCLRWIYGYMRLEICSKISLSADWCLCTALHTRSGACYYWIGLVVHAAKWMACFFVMRWTDGHYLSDRVQGVAELDESVPLCRVPAICRGHDEGTSYLLRHEPLGAGSPDVLLLRVRRRKTRVRRYKTCVCLWHGIALCRF